MHLEGSAYNWYLWWKNTARICSYNWVSFRNDLIKRFQGIEEKYFFAKITRLQQKIVSMSTPVNGKRYQLESQSYLMTNDYIPTYTI